MENSEVAIDRSNNTDTAENLNKPTDRHPLGRCGLCEQDLGASVVFTNINDEKRVMVHSDCYAQYLAPQAVGYYY